MQEVHRDAVLWVLNKPAGILSHPNPPQRKAPDALLHGVYNLKDECYQVRGSAGEERVYLVHRLDRGTSGVILCAFQKDAAQRLKADLREGRLRKEYQALVLGTPRASSGQWADRLAKKSGSQHATVSVRRGEPNARTTYKLIKAFRRPEAALLALFPETGRTHQIRVQAAVRSHPIIGDARYGNFEANRKVGGRLALKRMFLHCGRVELIHPKTHRPVTFEAPLPAALEAVLARLESLEA